MDSETIDFGFEMSGSTPLPSDKRIVPNQFPIVPQAQGRIAIIGEAPGVNEHREGKPFTGPSGRLLDGLLSRNGMLRSNCFIGNICQYRPPGNDISEFDWNGDEIQSGIEQLKVDLTSFQPNLIVALGGSALRAVCGDDRSIESWRGSLFWSPFGFKAMSSYHPAYCLRMSEKLPLLSLDLKKANLQRQTHELNLPIRQFDLHLSAYELADKLDRMRVERVPVSIDIEGYVNDMPCLSFSTNPLTGVIVPFSREQGRNHWDTAEEEAIVWLAVKRLLEDEEVEKVLQNGLYDRFVLAWSHGIIIRNLRYDTMLMHWEKYCELPKRLGLQASIYTNEPFYKGDRKAQDVKTFHTYCCKDSAVTLEIQERILPTLTPNERHSFEFNMAMQDPLLYMEMRGIRFDKARRDEKVSELQVKIDELNSKIEESVGAPLNVKSPKQKREYLYETLGLPTQYIRGRGKKVTTNYEAILNLAKKFPDKKELQDIIAVTSLRTRQSALGMGVDPDGRVRCSYNAFKKDEDKGGPTSTGRLACSESATGSGTNLQTITDEDRDLFLADPGHEVGQCDLSGADTWTVGAHSKRLGDSLMIEDLLHGIKVAKLLVLAVKGNSNIMGIRDFDELIALCKTVSKDDPLYFASKQGVHGSHYLMGKVTLSARIFIESEGRVNLPAATCEKIQQMYFRRYPGVQSWQRWVANEVRTKRQITSASGHTRRFFGNPNDDKTIKAALADEPQNNTTYATNLAALNLWKDPENKVASYSGFGSSDALRKLSEKVDRETVYWLQQRTDYGALLIEPLHQVHDSLMTQWDKRLRPWAVSKKRSYFQNELTIAGQKIIIPFSGQYGANWREAGDDDHNPNKI